MTMARSRLSSHSVDEFESEKSNAGVGAELVGAAVGGEGAELVGAEVGAELVGAELGVAVSCNAGK